MVSTFKLLLKQKSNEDVMCTDVIITDVSKEANCVAVGCKVSSRRRNVLAYLV